MKGEGNLGFLFGRKICYTKMNEEVGDIDGDGEFYNAMSSAWLGFG